ncbi:MAG: hypothetical protein BJ554DRAFT_7916 [Olpidium bornovanus]|uniref:Uncharacterized protein n=1 Tax=Olpidium bornovanus TaxID=278681 RepID=A0A8H7ZVA1_9FUNG|nr:MAG: hypothetical protein BJ554DRAFT_7916 [Olpidium bornovanus]
MSLPVSPGKGQQFDSGHDWRAGNPTTAGFVCRSEVVQVGEPAAYCHKRVGKNRVRGPNVRIFFFRVLYNVSKRDAKISCSHL